MKPLTWTEHQKMDALKVKSRRGTLTVKERGTLDKLVTRWKTAGDVPPKVLANMFSF
jgi:hypothetical protein